MACGNLCFFFSPASCRKFEFGITLSEVQAASGRLMFLRIDDIKRILRVRVVAVILIHRTGAECESVFHLGIGRKAIFFDFLIVKRQQHTLATVLT